MVLSLLSDKSKPKKKRSHTNSPASTELISSQKSQNSPTKTSQSVAVRNTRWFEIKPQVKNIIVEEASFSQSSSSSYSHVRNQKKVESSSIFVSDISKEGDNIEELKRIKTTLNRKKTHDAEDRRKKFGKAFLEAIIKKHMIERVESKINEVVPMDSKEDEDKQLSMTGNTTFSKKKAQHQQLRKQTKYPIQECFWLKSMQGEEQIFFITYNIETGAYCLEMFKQNQQNLHALGVAELLRVAWDTHEQQVHFMIATDEERKTAAIFFLNQSLTNSMDLSLFLVKASKINDDKLKERHDLPADFVDYEQKDDFAVMCESAIKKVSKIIDQDSHTTFQLRRNVFPTFRNGNLLAIFTHRRQPKMFEFDLKKIFGWEYENVYELDFHKASQQINFKFDATEKQRVVSVMKLQDTYLIIYNNGRLQRINDSDSEDVEHHELDFGYQKNRPLIKNCHVTELLCDKESKTFLIVCAKKLQNYLFNFEAAKGGWTFSSAIKISALVNFKIQKVYGRFLIGQYKRETQTKLIELGGKQFEKVKTAMALSKNESTTEVLSDNVLNNWMVSFQKRHRTFQWDKFEKLVCFDFVKKNELQHIFFEEILTINLNTNELHVSKLRSTRKPKVIKLPLKTRENYLQNFLPKMNNTFKLLLLMLTTEKVKNDWTEGRFHKFILVDVEHEFAWNLKLPSRPELSLPVKWAAFETENQLIFQNAELFFRVVIPQSALEIDTATRRRNILKKIGSNRGSDDSSDQGFGAVRNSIFISEVQVLDHCKIEEKALFFFDHKERNLYYVSKTEKKIGCYNLQAVVPQVQKQITKLQNDLGIFKMKKNASETKNQKKSKQEEDVSLSNDVNVQINRRRTQSKKVSQAKSNLANDIQNSINLQLPSVLQQRKNYRLAAIKDRFDGAFYVLFAHDELAWLQRIIKTEGSNNVTSSQTLGIAEAFDIRLLASNIIAIQSLFEVTVFNFETMSIEFKIKFDKGKNYEMSCSLGQMVICIPKRTMRFKFSDSLIEREKLLINQQNPLEKRVETQYLMSARRQTADLPVVTLYDLFAKFKVANEELFPADNLAANGYLCIDLNQAQELQKQTLLPISLKYPDYIMIDRDGVHSYSIEHTLLQLVYQTNTCIWDILIRQGILNNSVEISSAQMLRICLPLISNDNKSLLHLFSQNNFQALQEVFLKCDLSKFFDKSLKRFPFFRDFKKRTPLMYAYEKKNTKIFQFLLQKLIKFQDTFESYHIVVSWLEKAIMDELDINCVLDSNICTMRISKEKMFQNVKQQSQWPEMHSDDRTETAAYQHSFIHFIHDLDAYDDMFGKKFPNDEEEDNKLASYQQQYSIDYLLDFHMAANSNDQTFKLIKLLSESQNMSYFRSQYIQRMLNFWWEGFYKRLYIKFLAVHILNQLLIFLSVSTLNQFSRKVCHARIGINTINFATLCLLFFGFELKKIIKQRWDYLKQRSNIMVVIFYLSFILATVLDGVSCWSTDYDPEPLGVETADEEEGGILRFLKPKPSKKSAASLGYTMLPEELPINNAKRIFYSLLVFMSFLKLLKLMQIQEDFSFLIKMMQKVVVELIPFAVLFVSLLIVSTFAMHALATPLTDVDSANDYNGLDVPAVGEFLFVLRTALGDFQVGGFKRMQKATIFVNWVYWLILVVINCIIFLNFLIAVIGDVYNQVMDTRTEEVFQKKAEILTEFHEVFENNSKNNFSLLITRQKVQSDTEKWSGMINEIKSLLAQNEHSFQIYTEKIQISLSQQIEQRTDALDGKLQDMWSHNQLQLDEIRKKLDKLVGSSPSLRRQAVFSESQSQNQHSGESYLQLPDITAHKKQTIKVSKLSLSNENMSEITQVKDL